MRQGKKTHSPESFHTKVFTGRYVYSLYEYKSHKETCKQETSRWWNETGETIHSHENFHTEVFTGRYVYSLYNCKSHKETCIHTKGHAKEENLEKVE